jgi:hypothetical protein
MSRPSADVHALDARLGRQLQQQHEADGGREVHAQVRAGKHQLRGQPAVPRPAGIAAVCLSAYVG